MIYLLLRELAVDGVPVAVTCRVLKIARQPYYRWLAQPVTDAEWVTAHRANVLFDAHQDDPEFGHRFLAITCPPDRRAGDGRADRVADLLGQRLVERVRQAQERQEAAPGTPAHDDLVGRGSPPRHPTLVWLADITKHSTGEGKLYLCAIKDCFSNRIVGYSISDRMKSRLAVTALDNAAGRRRIDGRDVAGCILHTDRGSQFRSRALQRALTRHSMLGSMGQAGSAADNAAMESFFSLLQKNVLNRRRWATRDQLRIAIVTWIEPTYHRRRRQASLGRLTPIEYEIIMTAPASQAA